MDWLLPFRPPSGGGSSDPGLPKWLLRHVLRLGRISIGSHVLVAGTGRYDLAGYLDEMAIDAVPLEAPRRANRLPFSNSVPSVPRLLSDNGFDAVICREMFEHEGDLLGPGALRATARLAASVLPRGHLILIGRFDPQCSMQPGGHLESCFRQHLECFPGSCEVSHLADSLASRSTWNWMLGRQPRPGFVIASLAVPAVRIPQGEWERLADEAVANWKGACCPWRALEAESRPGLKSAA